jgi:hypothetical protein
MSLLYIAALGVWPIFFSVSSVLFRASGFNCTKKSFSDLGSHRTLGKLFNALLVSVGIIQLIILTRVLQIVSTLSEHTQFIAVVCLMVTTVMGIIEGVITKKMNERVHSAVGVIGFAFSAIGWIVLSVSLFRLHVFMSVVMGILGVMILTVVPYATWKFFRAKTCPAVYELILFIGAFVTNIVLSVMYHL